MFMLQKNKMDKNTWKKRKWLLSEGAAATADDYAFTHRLSTNNMGGPNKFHQYHKGNTNKPNKDKSY